MPASHACLTHAYMPACLCVQPVRCACVDNPFGASVVLKKTLPSLGSGLFPGDSGIKWDIFHVAALLRETTRMSHASLKVGRGAAWVAAWVMHCNMQHA